jgi:hypothetical protein
MTNAAAINNVFIVATSSMNSSGLPRTHELASKKLHGLEEITWPRRNYVASKKFRKRINRISAEAVPLPLKISAAQPVPMPPACGDCRSRLPNMWRAG